MPSFFVFAVIFTVFMLEGRRAIITAILEIFFFSFICFLAYRYPQLVQVHLETEKQLVIDIVAAFAAVSSVIGVSLIIHFNIYRQQQAKLDEQNELLSRASWAKTEFLSNSSHEMRTPLTVISVNVQTVMEILEDLDLNEKDVLELLQSTQQEVMHLARMVGGMLTLASMGENTEKQILSLSKLLPSSAEMHRLNLRKNSNSLNIKIEEHLMAFGNADLMAQVISNILSNANNYTLNGQIKLTAERDKGKINISLSDTGTGISPELLPHVFKRGISDKSTGFGLYLCKTVVESHGGLIWIESQQNVGTTVHLTLPYYEGQLGGTPK
jgi:signal transduction histidine kinase